MSLRNRTLVNMASSAAGVLVPLLVTFITTPLIIRLLGQEGYGLQNLAGAIGGFLGFLSMGLDVPIAKYVAHYNALDDRRAIGRLLDTAAMMCLLIGAVGLLAAVVFGRSLAGRVFHLSGTFSSEARIVFALSGVAFCISLVQSWAYACLTGFERFDRANLVQIPTAILSPLAGILAIYAGLGLIGFVAARILVMGIGTAFSLGQAFVFLPTYRVRPRIDWQTLGQIKGYLATGVFLRLMGFVAGGLDRTLIGAWISVSSVTAYAVQWSLISPLQSLLGNTFCYLFPMSSALHASGERERFGAIFLKSSALHAALACTAFGALFLFGTSFLRLWVGDAIAAEVRVGFPLLVVGAVASQLCSTFLNPTVVGLGRLRLYFGFSVARVILLGGALLVGVRHFALVGASGAYVVGGIAELGYLAIGVRSILGISFRQFLRRAYVKPMAVAAFLTVATWPLRDMASTWWRLAVLCALYVAVASLGNILFRAIPVEDIVRLFQSIKSGFLGRGSHSER
jgi:O-antigen/teichoic acid export membrane protein